MAELNCVRMQRITKLLNIATSKFDKQALAKWDIVASQQQAKLEQVLLNSFPFCLQ